MSTTFRKNYRELSEVEREQIEQIKDAAERLESLINGADTRTLPPSLYIARARYIALAITNLEQAVMWATKAWS